MTEGFSNACDEKMTDKDANEASASDGEQSKEQQMDNGNDLTMNSDSDDDGPKVTNKKSRRRVISDSDEDDEVVELPAVDSDAEKDEESDRNDEASDDENEVVPARSQKKTPPKNTKKKKTVGVDEAVRAVLNDSDSDGLPAEGGMDDGDSDSSQDSSDGSRSNSPVRLKNKDLYDAEDSSDEDRDLDTAAGADYDSSEDKDFDVSKLDPKLLKKLKKGAAKNKPMERKTRKCKPTKDDMLELHSESQRLLREAQVSLPYHQPAPKSLQDFLQRSRKKQEVYSTLKGARDIEKAQVIQEKLSESSIVALPRLRRPHHSSQKNSRSSISQSQQSLPDSGLDLHSQGHSQDKVSSQSAKDKETKLSSDSQPCAMDTDADADTLPDLTDRNHANGLFDSQHTLRSEGTTLGDSQELSQTISEDLGSQTTTVSAHQDSEQNKSKSYSRKLSDGDGETEMLVEEYDSPAPRASQGIEESESLSIKDCDSQRSDSGVAVKSVPDSLEMDRDCENVSDAVERRGSGDVTKAAASEKAHDVCVDSGEGVVGGDVDGKNVSRSDAKDKMLNDSARESTAVTDQDLSGKTVTDNMSDNKNHAENVNSDKTVTDNVDLDKNDEVENVSSDEELPLNPILAARQKVVEELAQKGIKPSLGRDHGQFIILDDPEDGEKNDKKSKGVKALMDRLIKQHQKRPAKRAGNVEISIIQKTGGEEGQEKDLKLKTVKYEPDVESPAHTPGTGLEALKRQLEVGMQKKRTAAYERRQQMYKMENEEGYEDGLPEDEEEAEMTDKSDTEGEDEEDEEEQAERKKKKKELDWDNPFLDEEADDDDDYEDDDIPQQPVCAEIDDDDDGEDLFQDSESLHLRLEEDDKKNDEDSGDDDDDDGDNNEDEDSVSFKKSKGHSQKLVISDDDEDSQDRIPSAQQSFNEDASEGVQSLDTSQVGSDNESQIPAGQDPSKTCLPQHRIDWRKERMANRKESSADKIGMNSSFEILTPMTLLLQDTQPSQPSRTQPLQPIEDSQDLYGGDESDANSSVPHISFSEDASQFDRLFETQVLQSGKSGLFQESSQESHGDDAIMGLMSGKFAESQSGKSSLFQESSQESHGDDDLMGLMSGKFAQSQDLPASTGFGGSSGFGGWFGRSQTEEDSGSVASLFDSSSQSQDTVVKDDGDLLGICSGKFQSQSSQRDSGKHQSQPSQSQQFGKSQSQSQQFGKSQSQSQQFGRSQSSQNTEGDMDDLVGLCSGEFHSQNSESLKVASQEPAQSQNLPFSIYSRKSQAGTAPAHSSPKQSQSQGPIPTPSSSKRGVKRRLIIPEDSSDEEGERGTGPFRLLSDDEATKDDSDNEKNELSGSDEEDQEEGNEEDEQEEEEVTFKGRSKGQILKQFVEHEAELSGSEAESDEDLDLAEEDDYLEMEAGDNDVDMNEDQLRDQVGRVHMKQMLDDDDRALMRYKEMYLPDGDLHSEGAGRFRRFHWNNMEDSSQQDMFAAGSDEENEEVEDPEDKKWRMERYEREKFLESQQMEVTADPEDTDSQFTAKFGKFLLKKQISEPTPSVAAAPAKPVEQPEPSVLKLKPVRSHSMTEKTSPGKFVKPKIPKKGSFLQRSKENLKKIAEITKSSGLNVNGTRGSRSFVFSINSAEKGSQESGDGSGDKLLSKTSAQTTPTAPAVKKLDATHRPAAKKPCLQPSAKPTRQKSIFNLLDK